MISENQAITDFNYLSADELEENDLEGDLNFSDDERNGSYQREIIKNN